MRFSLVSLLAASALVTGCGSNGTTTATNDGGVTASEAGADASVSDAGPSADTGAGDTGAKVDAGPNCLVSGTTADQCRTCCENGYPAGSKLFDQYTIACACQAALCGPPDGGLPDAGDDAGDAGDAAADGGDAGAPADDGGLYGKAACAATCDGTQAPDTTCNSCILSTLGEVSSLGPCGASVVGSCLSESTGVCSTYFACVQNCPVP